MSKNLLTAYIRGRMYEMDMSQQKLSKKLGMAQQTFSYKLTHNSFTIAELGRLFKCLETPNEIIGYLIKERDEKENIELRYGTRNARWLLLISRSQRYDY